ncbi:MAG: ribosome-associated translation inhibitor RaiA [Eubacterium sp.]|jgi:putative sigma-54 modulation protein|nr:ribosome-associated translation inhibitor RaiA [Eubacterium sp.]
MMKVNITAKKMQVNGDFQEYAEKKLKKLDRFFGEEANAKITLSAIRDTITLELTVKHDNLIFRSEQSAVEKNEALDSCVDRIIRQIRKNKTKIEKRLHSSAFSEEFHDEVEEQPDFKVIKHKEFILRPMSVDEAILQMNMLGHRFFMFKNGDSGDTNVVYRRDDGHYSVLQPRKD